MCLLAVLYKTLPSHPIVLAANRDELHDRQGSLPEVWERTGTRFLAPKDCRAGGTWIGLNEHQMAAAITNRAEPRAPVGVRSRGLLTVDVLGSLSPAQAARLVKDEVARSTCNGFNLFCAGPDEGFIAHYDGELEITPLESGVYVIGNRDLNDMTCWKVARTHALLERMDGTEPEGLVAGLKTMLADHARPGPADNWAGNDDEPICVHGEKNGTLSSTIMLVGRGEESTIYLHSQGSPCTTRYERCG
ncbi:MAG: NRDE family protein [Planctomycetes bacterium]|nr:NRDE family protein [Planctomycetota bacterium]